MTDTHEIVLAGFGGQGVMLMGQLITYAGMLEGKGVSWLPSYGPEMRGGTANCTVVVADGEIGSPVVSRPSSMVAMNLPSLLRFEPSVREGGALLYNNSLITEKPGRADVRVLAVPANDVAAELGNAHVANMVALGALLAVTGVVRVESVMDSLRKVLPGRHHHLLPLNREALERGIKIAAEAGLAR